MALSGWKQMLDGWPWFQGEGSYPILPNSEYMPPLRLGLKPYGTRDSTRLDPDDPFGWPVTEYEEALILRPGMQSLADQVLHHLLGVWRHEETDVIGVNLTDNPYCPQELLHRSHKLAHERFVLLLPMALSRTLDDKARDRWTLFGNSEQGPARPFWKSFFRAPGQEHPGEVALAFLRRLLEQAYGEQDVSNLYAAGLRVLPQGDDAPFGPEGELPSWTKPLLFEESAKLRGVRYLLTFRPFQWLSAAVRRRYLAGELHLLPCPASLLFWGVEAYRRLESSMPFADQVPLLHLVERHLGIHGIRVPQAGWFTEEGPAYDPQLKYGPIRSTYRRTHRAARVLRYDETLVRAREHHLTHVLFSTRPEDIDLYHKPMARNVQLWGHDFTPLLDGPRAGADDIRRACERVGEGGLFGYRVLWPAMQLGCHELFWHRPLVAHLEAKHDLARLVADAPSGYLTGYHAAAPDRRRPIELWPRLLRREAHVVNTEEFANAKETPPHRTLGNILRIFSCWEMQQKEPLAPSFARQLLIVQKRATLDGWLRNLPKRAGNAERGRWLAEQLRAWLAVAEEARAPRAKEVPAALTYGATTRRSFEAAYWRTIALLSTGQFQTKNNADCILDQATQARLRHHERDLEPLGDYLLGYYTALVAEYGLSEHVLVGELPFRWQTQYAFPWMGGWLCNQDDRAYERNLLVVIPGRDRSQAVLFADHYDTAYMCDCFDKDYGGDGARLAAPGADDNGSATAALMLGARPFLELSRAGQLGCDIWLLHLTGEEYPAEGLGACRMCQWLVERTLPFRTLDGLRHDLTRTAIRGLFVLDMIAHNNPKGRDVFQISPGVAPGSLWLAQLAHRANLAWNRGCAVWNRRAARKKAGRARRCRDNRTLPRLARHLPLHGEVRLSQDPRSTLFNTDGQAFSDVGVPVVLFMENYDIERVGYHDTHDTMNLIDLDYGSALAAIAIESVARAATEEPPTWA
jgi:hypothetical protein